MQTQVNVRSECSELTNTAHAGLRSARRRIGTLAAVLALSVLPQQVLSQVRPSKSRATPAATRLVPSQGVVAVAPARSKELVSVQHVERVNLVGLGGRIYSTGLEEVYVRIVPVQQVSWKREKPYLSHIYLLSPGKTNFLGSNFDDRVIRLGRLPAGEIKLGIDTFGADAGSVQTGPGERNPDNLPHAKATQLPSGVVEVRFEDLLGLPERRGLRSDNSPAEQAYAHRNFLSDVIVQFSGGVSASDVVMQTLEMLKHPDPEVRKVAAEALRVASPQTARSAGLFGR